MLITLFCVNNVRLRCELFMICNHQQEEECVENLFDALAAALLVPDNQARFRYGKEGQEGLRRVVEV